MPAQLTRQTLGICVEVPRPDAGGRDLERCRCHGSAGAGDQRYGVAPGQALAGQREVAVAAARQNALGVEGQFGLRVRGGEGQRIFEGQVAVARIGAVEGLLGVDARLLADV